MAGMKVQRVKQRVFVGLSGGVDSSVSAALLKNAGYDVTGVFIRVWQPDFFECTWKDDRLDAMRVCAKLSIPFMELDLEKEYKREVVDYMIREYKEGKTPNPDVMCNRYIKFGGFYKWAIKNGADFIATGHYARIVESLKFKVKSRKTYELRQSLDENKDQSYFLWQIRKEQLPHILFPVGGMKKPEVRKLAKQFGLITAEKKDSQGLCFIGKIDIKEFLSHYIKQKRGNILDEQGNVIGEHAGVFFYTLGERIGNLSSSSTKGGHPVYVIAKDILKNTITVSRKSSAGILTGALDHVDIEKCNWLVKPTNKKEYQVQTRYHQHLQSARLIIHTSKFSIQFESPQTMAPGQSLVLYDGEVLVGGGIICS